MKQQRKITTWLFGTGKIVSNGVTHEGVRWWLAVFPGFGRKFISQSHRA